MSRLHSLYKNGIVVKKKGGFSNYSMYEYIYIHNGVYKRKKLLPRPYCNSTKNIHIEYLDDELK